MIPIIQHQLFERIQLQDVLCDFSGELKVVAERLSHAVETYGLLPTNHFGARKQRSAEQALLLLQSRCMPHGEAEKS